VVYLCSGALDWRLRKSAVKGASVLTPLQVSVTQSANGRASRQPAGPAKPGPELHLHRCSSHSEHMIRRRIMLVKESYHSCPRRCVRSKKKSGRVNLLGQEGFSRQTSTCGSASGRTIREPIWQYVIPAGGCESHIFLVSQSSTRSILQYW